MAIVVLGSINMDVVLEVAALPKPGETVTNATIAQHPGGKGANQAIAAARLGSQTSLIAAIGKDETGPKLVANLRSAGVDVTGVFEAPNRPTGQAFIMVARDGENSIVVVPGANQGIAPARISTEIMSRGQVFLAQLEVPVVAAQSFFTNPSARSGLRLLNAAPYVLGAKSLFPLVDGIIVNETELAAHAGVETVPETVEEIATLARHLIAQTERFVVVTLGKRGALAVTGQKFVEYAPYNVEVVDTTGAGDCFCGAFAAALDAGQGLDSAMHFANAAAAISTTRRGAAPAMPTRAEVEARLAPEPESPTD